MTSRDEASAILALAGGDALTALRLVESQLNVLYTRAQVLLSLAGAVVTVTGFSGRAIAATSRSAQMLLVAGLALVLFGAVWVFLRVTAIRWVTAEFDSDARASLERILTRRDAKSRAYALGGRLLCLGLASYCCAIALMLWRAGGGD